MNHREQKSSAVGVTVAAIVVALGLLCLLGVVLFLGLAFFGISYRAQSTPVRVVAQPLPAPSTASYPPVYTDPSATPGYAPVPIVSSNVMPAMRVIEVRCDSEGTLTLDGEAIELDGLVERLDANIETVMVSLTVNATCPYRHVVDVQDRVQQAGHVVTCRVAPDDSVAPEE